MSGIAAAIRFDGGPALSGLVETMTAAMDFRGPDGIHHWTDGAAAIGQCLLCTTAESLAETLPLVGEDSRLALVMDGRLDNWEELRGELLAKGVRLRGRTDSELVLRAYETWGADCAARLDGDFVFVIWDQQRREAFCVRDQTGAKPLHYHWNGQRLLIASDLHAIYAAAPEARAPNEGMLAEILAGEWYARDETLWRGIMKLTPAHQMRAAAGGLTITRYWAPPLDAPLPYKRDEEYFEHYRALLADCVRRASRSHLPVAYEVSGGLDSSAIFCMAENLRKDARLPAPAVRGYTWGFHDNSAANETRYARDVGAHLGLTIAEIAPFRPDRSWFEARFRADRNLPNYPNGAMAVSLNQAMRADGCRVVLNGEGGDEWLGGRRHYYAEQLAGRQWSELRKSFQADAAAYGFRQAAAWLTRHGIVHLLPRSIKQAGRRLIGPHGPNNHDSAYWLSPAMQRLFGERRAQVNWDSFLKVRNIAQRTLLMLLYNSFADHVREMIDRGAARNGLESRSPMYSRRFIEFAFATPASLRLRGAASKFAHVKALQGLLPQSVAERQTKADFSIAFTWQLDTMNGAFLDTLAHESGGRLSAEGLSRLLAAYRDSPPGARPMWELWTAYACVRILAAEDRRSA